MKHGSDWYKRDPAAYLGGVQGLTAKEHAVYAVTLDLIYAHGGAVNNDPAWIAGWIKDMGSASVRSALNGLESRGKLIITETEITQKRARNEAKTKENLSETARENGKKGGKKSAEKRARVKENNNLGEAVASSENQADKIRLDKKEVDKSTSTQEVEVYRRYLDAHPNPVSSDAGVALFNGLVEAGVEPEQIISAAKCYAKRTSTWSGDAKVQQSDNFLDPDQGQWRENLPRDEPKPPCEDENMRIWADRVKNGRGFGLQRKMAEELVAQGLVSQDQINQARGYSG